MQHRVFLIIVLPEQKGFLTLWCPLPTLPGMAIDKLNSEGTILLTKDGKWSAYGIEVMNWCLK